MENKDLNENDIKLLGFCIHRERYMSDIARHIGIDIKNISVRVPILERMGLIEIHSIGNKKYIRTKKTDQTKKYFTEILKILKSKPEGIRYEDYMALIPFNPEDDSFREKYSAPLKLLWSQPKLVEQYIRITDEGLRFLKENSVK